jgi:hypothetical protein
MPDFDSPIHIGPFAFLKLKETLTVANIVRFGLVCCVLLLAASPAMAQEAAEGAAATVTTYAPGPMNLGAAVGAGLVMLGAGLVMALRGDRAVANDLIKKVNAAIELARSADGNEGLTINDVTPDFIRVRGLAIEGLVTGPYTGADWGGGWPSYI